MKETPIIFSTDMVKAILEGRKTQTRRIVAPRNSVVGEGSVDWADFDFNQSTYWSDEMMQMSKGEGQLGSITDISEKAGGQAPPVLVDDSFGLHYLHVPYKWSEQSTIYRIYPRYEVGDRLWVRETWGVTYGWDNEKPSEIDPRETIYYKAGGSSGNIGTHLEEVKKWRPSIHMPRWASRITLEVTEVRVERLQEISEEGAIAEGAELGSARGHFSILWDSINAKRGNWEVNPWVWVVGFRRVDG